MYDLTEIDLMKNAELLYRFVALFSNYESIPRDYGCGEPISMVEVHMLSTIDANPEITATELAQRHMCTKSAVSQILKKLEERNYIIRVASEHDSKKKRIFVSAEGKRICQAHDEFDIKTLAKTYRYLLRDCTPEEIQCFYKVMNVYNNIMEAGNRKQKRLLKEKLEQNKVQ